MIFVSSGLFTTIVCCLQHVEILTNSVSARHRRNVWLFQRWNVWKLFIRANYLPRLFAIHNTSKYWRTLYWKVTARNVRFSDLFAKFGGRRRRNKNCYRPDCFSAESHQDWFFKRIIYHDCLLLTTRRNINELCIGKSAIPSFPFRQLRRSTSSKQKQVSAKLL